MEASSFARLAQLAAAASRRGALKSVLASTLVGLGSASLLSVEETGAKKRKRKDECRLCILSSGPYQSAQIPRISVDDDLTVFLNGQILFQDEDEGSSTVGPFVFAGRRGDRLRIVAVDTDPDCHELSPLFLRCGCGDTPRKLSDGVPEECPDIAVGEFFDETFTI